MRTDQANSRQTALAARASKRAHAESLGIDEQFVGQMVEQFYDAVRKDEFLGPIFAIRIADWPEHLERMKSFWRSVLFNSGEFSGNPMLKHTVIPELNESHFVRWLDLFYATLKDLEVGVEGVQLVAGRARAIADSLLTGIRIQRDGLTGSKAGESLPHV